MEIEIVAAALVALALGVVIGWLVAARQAAGLKAERDQFEDRFRAAISDLASAEDGRAAAERSLAALAAERAARDEAHAQQVAQLQQARDGLAAQFQDVSTKLLAAMQGQFLESADARFKASEAQQAARLAALLQPVDERLKRYEEAVSKVEAERREAYGNLQGLMESLRTSNESVKAEAARLGNALRNAPKARGRWGEQQLRNVLEACGLSEYADFRTEVSVTGEDGERLRPDVIIRVPGGHHLVVDAKVSLNAYQDAFEADDEARRAAGLAAHAAAVKAHVNALGNKAYWSQFETAPDYVILFLPGEHFLSAALEQDQGLWDQAFERRVLLATPTNLIAIARTVAAVWRQEQLAKEAQEIGRMGAELYERLRKSAEHLKRVGSGLESAVKNYNSFVGSFERNVLSSGRRLADKGVEMGKAEIEDVPFVESTPRYNAADVAALEAPDHESEILKRDAAE